MTVFELAKQLAKYPGNWRVVMDGKSDYYADIEDIRQFRIEKQSDAGLWESVDGADLEEGKIEEAIILTWW